MICRSLLAFAIFTLATRGGADAQAPAAAGAASASPATQAPEDLDQYKTADALWTHIQELEAGPATRPDSREQMAAYVRRVMDAESSFAGRFPQDERRWEATLMGLQSRMLLSQLNGSEPDMGKVEGTLKEMAAAPNAPMKVKAEARFNLLEIHLASAGEDTLSPAQEKEMTDFIHDFPDSPKDAMLDRMRLKRLESDPAKHEALLTEMQQSGNQAVAAVAAAELKMREIKKTPFDLSFTAVDGTKVDLGKMRGKVVLVDFWASWCGPCMRVLPSVVELYNRLHAKGLDVVGISLDQDKEKMEAAVKENGVSWPEYFDGKGWENEISSRYGIDSIPRMWLVNKKGMVVSTDAGEDLEGAIQKLLAE